MECGGRGKSGRQTVSPLPERRESNREMASLAFFWVEREGAGRLMFLLAEVDPVT